MFELPVLADLAIDRRHAPAGACQREHCSDECLVGIEPPELKLILVGAQEDRQNYFAVLGRVVRKKAEPEKARRQDNRHRRDQVIHRPMASFHAHPASRSEFDLDDRVCDASQESETRYKKFLVLASYGSPRKRVNAVTPPCPVRSP
ncbi:hypothetical protein MPLSOD_340057 [Mesorhizobium sp. SOD10]|nr:hypothetical protein MPLSOD_340057 [Mesorhizobium sp. SOD10]